MDMEKQSVRIGVDRFFYAKLIEDTDSGATYEPPTHLPGVNVVSLSSKSEIGTFYADDGVFETFPVEGDKLIQVSFAGISNKEVSELTGANYEAGLLVDKKTDIPPYMAIGFRTQKSNGSYRYVWIHKGRFAKADLHSYSKTGSISPQPDIYSFTAVNRVNDGAWRQMLDSDDESVSEVLTEEELNSKTTGWFSDPNFEPSA